MVFIIGSGPAGVATATALLARGLHVTMLDVGTELDKGIQEKLARFRNQPTLSALEEFKYNLNTDDKIKLSYGSDYIYRVNGLVNFMIDQQVYCMPSLAKGGLSNVWGAVVASFGEEDLDSWPFSTDTLEPYYQKVLEFLPLASSQKSKDNAYSFYFNPSEQAQYLINEYAANAEKLYACGFNYQSARLAVSFADARKQYCTYCGMCQYGCPNSLIYSAAHTLEKLKENDNFKYMNQFFVQRIEENNEEMLIHVLKTDSLKKDVIKASQVFVAAGAVFSSIIVLNSLDEHPEKISISDSQHFMFPCVLFKKIKNPLKENLHTLTQLSLKLKSDDFLEGTCHLQIYTYMDLYQREFKKMFGKFYPLLKLLLSPLLSRLIVIQGFLHSKDSGGFSLQIQKDPLKAQEIGVSVNKIENKTSVVKIKRILSYLMKKSFLLKFIPLGFLLKISKPGRSYHYGGSFPMSKNPTASQTDVLGRLNGFKRLHIVDASVFPTIPSKSPTFTIMANAYRIAMECPIL